MMGSCDASVDGGGDINYDECVALSHSLLGTNRYRH